ncbi:hypothetical protein C0584_04130 [Candidatus Parcubacteria bacterium]|nr:MAG: hypothetical protein C0584_04130 [Candidatus Parcubacteria bacterium]
MLYFKVIEHFIFRNITQSKGVVMPNIHLIGFTEEEFSPLKKEIDRIIESMGAEHEVITTFHPNALPESCDGAREKMPYLHIFGTNPVEIEKIIRNFMLRGLFFDIEYSIGGFLEKSVLKETHYQAFKLPEISA